MLSLAVSEPGWKERPRQKYRQYSATSSLDRNPRDGLLVLEMLQALKPPFGGFWLFRIAVQLTSA